MTKTVAKIKDIIDEEILATMDEVETIIEAVGRTHDDIWHEQDARIKDLKEKFGSSDLFREFEDLILDGNKKHVDVINNVRSPLIAQIRQKYQK